MVCYTDGVQQKSNNTAIIGIIAVILIAAAVVGTIALKPSKSNTSDSAVSSGSTVSTIDANASYKDGTYSATSSYRTPETVEEIAVTLTITNNKVSEVSVSQDAQARESRAYQADFADGYKAFVIGKDIGTLELSRVSGASLTPRGFNDALNTIRSQAKV